TDGSRKLDRPGRVERTENAREHSDRDGTRGEPQGRELAALERGSERIRAPTPHGKPFGDAIEHGVQRLEIRRDEELRLRSRDVVVDLDAAFVERQLADLRSVARSALTDRRQKACAVERVLLW